MRKILAWGQYATTIATIGINIILSLGLSREAFGEYTAATLPALLITNLYDPGLNALFISRRLSMKRYLARKAIAVAITCLCLGALTTLATQHVNVLLICLIPPVFSAFSAIDCILLLGQHFRWNAVSRSCAAIFLMAFATVAAVKFSSPTAAVVALLAAYFLAVTFAVLIAMAIAAWDLPDPHSDTRELGLPLLTATLIQLPQNVVSNGLVLFAGFGLPPEATASFRLQMLVVGGLMALAPLSSMQVLALRATEQKADEFAIARRVLILVATATALAAPWAVDWAYGREYVEDFSLFVLLILLAPLLFLTLARLVSETLPMAGGRAALISAIASTCSVFVVFLLPASTRLVGAVVALIVIARALARLARVPMVRDRAAYLPVLVGLTAAIMAHV